MTTKKQEINLTDEHLAELLRAWLDPESVRTKADLREWKGAPTFHLNQEPRDYQQ